MEFNADSHSCLRSQRIEYKISLLTFKTIMNGRLLTCINCLYLRPEICTGRILTARPGPLTSRPGPLRPAGPI